MKKLLLLLFISLGLINSSFAGVKDISLKCENGDIYETWYSKKYQTYLDFNKNGPGTIYNTSLIIIADSSNSVKVDLSLHFKYSNILEGKYRLTEESPDYYYFEKNLKFDGNQGRASLSINRENGMVIFGYTIKVNEVYREFSTYHDTGYMDFIIEKHSGSFHKKNYNICEKYQRLF